MLKDASTSVIPPELSLKKKKKKRERKPRFRFFTEKYKPEKRRILACFQQFEKTYLFQNLFYRKSTCDIYVLQSLQGQLLDFHSLTAFLSLERELMCLKAGEISFHILGSMKETNSLPF